MSLSLPNYTVVLLGKTGNGKSSTGNTLLDRKVFNTLPGDASSVTSDCQLESVSFGNFILKVIDTPGIMDTEHSQEETLKKIYNVMSLCPESCNAFIFVLKYGIKLTKDEICAYDIMKRSFGELFTKLCFIVITYGEDFEYDYKDVSIEEWFDKQHLLTTHFGEMKKRVHVFFNKREEYKVQRDENRMKLINQIVQYKISYFNSDFEKASEERKKISIEHKIPQLLPRIQQGISLIQSKIEKITDEAEKMDDEKIRDIENELKEFLNYLRKEDKKTGAMSKFIEEVKCLRPMLKKTLKSKIKRKKMLEYLNMLRNPPSKIRLTAARVASCGTLILSGIMMVALPLTGLVTVPIAAASVAATDRLSQYHQKYYDKVAELKAELGLTDNNDTNYQQNE